MVYTLSAVHVYSVLYKYRVDMALHISKKVLYSTFTPNLPDRPASERAMEMVCNLV